MIVPSFSNFIFNTSVTVASGTVTANYVPPDMEWLSPSGIRIPAGIYYKAGARYDQRYLNPTDEYWYVETDLDFEWDIADNTTEQANMLGSWQPRYHYSVFLTSATGIMLTPYLGFEQLSSWQDFTPYADLLGFPQLACSGMVLYGVINGGAVSDFNSTLLPVLHNREYQIYNTNSKVSRWRGQTPIHTDIVALPVELTGGEPFTVVMLDLRSFVRDHSTIAVSNDIFDPDVSFKQLGDSGELYELNLREQTKHLIRDDVPDLPNPLDPESEVWAAWYSHYSWDSINDIHWVYGGDFYNMDTEATQFNDYFFKYTETTNTWETLTPSGRSCPGDMSYEGPGFFDPVTGYLIRVMGVTYDRLGVPAPVTYSGAVIAYDPATNTIFNMTVSGSPVPGTEIYYESCGVDLTGRKIYLQYGCAADTTSFWAFDMTTGYWTEYPKPEGCEYEPLWPQHNPTTSGWPQKGSLWRSQSIVSYNPYIKKFLYASSKRGVPTQPQPSAWLYDTENPGGCYQYLHDVTNGVYGQTPAAIALDATKYAFRFEGTWWAIYDSESGRVEPLTFKSIDGGYDMQTYDWLQLTPRSDCLYLGSIMTNGNGSIKQFNKNGWTTDIMEDNIQTGTSGIVGSYESPYYWCIPHWAPTATELKFEIDMPTTSDDTMKLYRFGCHAAPSREIKKVFKEIHYPMPMPGIWFIHNASHTTVSGYVEADHLTIYHLGYKE